MKENVVCPGCGRGYRYILGHVCGECRSRENYKSKKRQLCWKRGKASRHGCTTPHPDLEQRLQELSRRRQAGLPLFPPRRAEGEDDMQGPRREVPPSRRPCWRQEATVGGTKIYLTCGERPDGTLLEIFLDAAKQGSFVRGVLDALARVVSLALQCGTPLEMIVKALRHLNFPPNGAVMGSRTTTVAASVADWIAQELAAAYLPVGKDGPPGSGSIQP